MAKRRRQYIVDRAFQLKYTLLISLVGGLIALIFGWWMYDAHRENTDLLRINSLLQMDESLKEQLAQGDQNLLWIYIGITVLMMIALGLLGVLVTHRVAGPAYIMGRYLTVIGDGAYPKLRPLRKKDELRDFFESLNRAVETLRERDRSEAEAIEKAIEALEGDGSKEEALAALRKIAERKRQSVAGATTVEDA